MSIENPAIAYSLADDGELAPGVCLLPELTVDLPGGLVGYCQRTFDDCLKAAASTAAQIPYEATAITTDKVNPWLALPPFAVAHGLEFEGVDLSNPPETPWLALSAPIQGVGEPFIHALTFRGSELLFDPFAFIRPDGRRLRDELPPLTIAEGFHFYERTPDGPCL